jgi:hypothetical protein
VAAKGNTTMTEAGAMSMKMRIVINMMSLKMSTRITHMVQTIITAGKAAAGLHVLTEIQIHTETTARTVAAAVVQPEERTWITM